MMLAAVAALASFTSRATPVASPEVLKMTNAANVIVAGRVTARQSGPVSNWTVPVTLTVAVSRTLKGAPYPAGTLLKVSYVDRPSSYIRINRDSFSLFFLRCSAATVCSQAMPFHLDAPSLPQGPEEKPSADPAQRVRDELLALVAADDPVLAGLSSSSGGDAERAYSVRLDAMSLLRAFPMAPVVDELKRLAQAPAAAPRLAALSLLARADDYSMLAKADTEMLYPMPATEWMARHLSGTISGSSRTLPPDVVEPVSRWLRSRDVEVRRDAARVLSSLGTPAAATPLARFGLDDPDREVRYFSVGGLMAAFEDGGYPSIDLYDRDEHRHLDPWLRWRDEHREALEQGTCCPWPKPERSSSASGMAGRQVACETRMRVGDPPPEATCAPVQSPWPPAARSR